MVIWDPPPSQDWSRGGLVPVEVRWEPGMPAARLLAGIRSLVPPLRQVALPRLRAELATRSGWVLEPMEPDEAQALQARARELGLDVEIGDPISPDAEHQCVPDRLPMPEQVRLELCTVCQERPGRMQPSQSGPISSFMCDECAMSTVELTPLRLLAGLGALGAVVWLLYRLLFA